MQLGTAQPLVLRLGPLVHHHQVRPGLAASAMSDVSLKNWLRRIATSAAILAAIWVVAYWFVGANAAFGVVLLAIVLGIIGAFVT